MFDKGEKNIQNLSPSTLPISEIHSNHFFFVDILCTADGDSLGEREESGEGVWTPPFLCILSSKKKEERGGGGIFFLSWLGEKQSLSPPLALSVRKMSLTGRGNNGQSREGYGKRGVGAGEGGSGGGKGWGVKEESCKKKLCATTSCLRHKSE